jgi:hypothetical protein
MLRSLLKACAPAAALCAAALLTVLPARAAFVVNPLSLYREMLQAYDRGNAHGWTFDSQQFYLETLFDAGRAYALQRADDPSFPRLEQMTVDVAAGVHYDPLIDHDAVPWYVRQAAVYVERNQTDPQELAKATALLARVDAIDDPEQLAKFADEDAQANASQFPGDRDAMLATVEANWRGWLLTHDQRWLNLAFVRASALDFPIGNLPTTWGPGFITAVKAAAGGDSAYTQDERDNASVILGHLDDIVNLHTIAAVKSQASHAFQMTTLAPADEYFGPMGMSVLGIRNELKRINYYIDYGYDTQESSAAVAVAVSIDDLHRVYPRDRDLPQMLLEAYTTLKRIHTPDAAAAMQQMRAILTVEYQDSPQARRLLGVGSTPSP